MRDTALAGTMSRGPRARARFADSPESGARVAAAASRAPATPAQSRHRRRHGRVPSHLYSEDLLFLLFGQLVHLADESIGGLLDLVVAPALIVLRDLLVLGERLQPIVGVAANVPD